MFDPLPDDRGQPEEFNPGRVIDAFQVDFGDRHAHVEARRPTGLRVKWLAAVRRDDPDRQDARADYRPRPLHARDRRQRRRQRRRRRRSGDDGRRQVAPRFRRGPCTPSASGRPGTKAEDYATTIVCRTDRGGGAELGSSNIPSLGVSVSSPGRRWSARSATGDREAHAGPADSGTEPPIPEPLPPFPPFPPIPPTLSRQGIRSTSR